MCRRFMKLKKEGWNMEKTRVAIIGTGGIANAHMRAYQQIPEVEIVAGVDIIPGKAREFLDQAGSCQHLYI